MQNTKDENTWTNQMNCPDAFSLSPHPDMGYGGEVGAGSHTADVLIDQLGYHTQHDDISYLSGTCCRPLLHVDVIANNLDELYGSQYNGCSIYSPQLSVFPAVTVDNNHLLKEDISILDNITQPVGSLDANSFYLDATGFSNSFAGITNQSSPSSTLGISFPNLEFNQAEHGISPAQPHVDGLYTDSFAWTTGLHDFSTGLVTQPSQPIVSALPFDNLVLDPLQHVTFPAQPQIGMNLAGYSLNEPARLDVQAGAIDQPITIQAASNNPEHSTRGSSTIRYRCSRCTKTFGRDADRKRHAQQFHGQNLGPSRLPCPFAGCTKTYSRADKVTAHYKQKHGNAGAVSASSS